MSLDKARAALEREEEYLKDVKKAVERQLAVPKVSQTDSTWARVMIT